MATHVRWMIRRDMAEVMAIESARFPYSWTEEEFLQALRDRATIGMVAEQGETVVGFMLYRLHKGKLELLNLAVAPSHRRKGIGKTLVEKLVSKLSSHRRNRISFTVRETAIDLQLFLKAMGFEAISINRRYYADSEEDGFKFVRRIAAHVAQAEPVQ